MRLSTRATSLGSDRARKELGRTSGLSRMNVPSSTICVVRRCHSASEPSHQITSSGWVNAATSSTHSSNFLLRVGGFSRPRIVMGFPSVERRCPRATRVGPWRHGVILPFLQAPENRENPYTVMFVSKGTGGIAPGPTPWDGSDAGADCSPRQKRTKTPSRLRRRGDSAALRRPGESWRRCRQTPRRGCP